MVKPSVEGNIVTFYDPDMESVHKQTGEINGVTFNMEFVTGSVELNYGVKTFKNDKGQVYKIEKYDLIAVKLISEWR